MADEKFKLPGASYEELAKIITAYANVNKEASPAEIGSLAGKAETEVSRNNGFLLAMGIVEGGPRGRLVTAEGRALGRAIEHDQQDDVVTLWRALCERSEFVQKVLSAVRVRRGMERSTLVSHVVYTAAQKKTAQTTAGANCLLDILSLTSLLVEDNGKLTAPKAERTSSVTNDLSEWRTVASGETLVQSGPAITYDFETEPRFTTFGTYPRLPFEIRLNVTVQCSVDEIPSLAPRIRQLIRDLTSPPADKPAGDQPTE
jgi:hypothetical protein